MKVDTKEMIDEHKKLINVLESSSHEEDKKEAKKQRKELEEYKDEVEKSEDNNELQKAYQALGIDIKKGGIGSGKHKTINWLNDNKNDKEETKAFKKHYMFATKEQREHVAEKYFGDKNKDLTSVGAHHHEQLAQGLHEKMKADKEGVDVKKSEDDDLQKAYQVLGINL